MSLLIRPHHNESLALKGALSILWKEEAGGERYLITCVKPIQDKYVCTFPSWEPEEICSSWEGVQRLALERR
jgi:hypothetical protein